MALPDCICVSGQPLGDQLAAIYCAAYTWTEDESLPTCVCVDGYTLSDKLFAIYQAVFTAAEDDTLTAPYCVRGHPLSDQLTEIYTALLLLTGGADLPTAICVRGMTLFQQVDAIFCAALSVEVECAVPTLVSATIVGSVLTLVFSVDVTGSIGFTIDVDGSNDPLTYVSGDGTDTLVFNAETDAAEGDEVLLDYTPGNVANRECPLVAISDFVVTNDAPGLFFTLDPVA
jgi:hypothetical protein